MTQPDTLDNSVEFNWDFLDVVASKGACLVTRPNTPIHPPRRPEAEIEKFATALDSKLRSFLRRQEIRWRKYGDAAFEHLPQHTPPNIVEEREKELETLYALMDAPSPASDCGDGEENDGKADLERRRELERMLRNHISCPHLEQSPPAVRLPTPSPSNLDSTYNSTPSSHRPPSPKLDDVALEAQRGKKRRLKDAEDSEHRDKKVRTIAAVSNRPRRSARLRRGTG